MSTVITTNIWRHFQPSSFKLKYGVKPNTYVYVDLTIELMQGTRSIDQTALDTYHKQMGYICNYVIDIEPENGTVIPRDDGRGFFYQPDKDFIGDDFVSYRIINVMGQTSEPQCIYFNVNPTIKVNGRIEEQIIKLDTVILHNGNSDKFYESITTTNTEKKRDIYAFNILPESWYVLMLQGSWGDSFYGQRGSWLNWWIHTGFTVQVNKMLGLYKTSEGAEFEVLSFTDAISLEALGIPDILNDRTIRSPQGVEILSPFINLYFVLSPVGDTRLYAKDSNILPYVYYDPQPYIDAGLPFPEDDPKVSEELSKKIVKSNVDIEIINENKKRKLLMLVNGKDLVAIKKPVKLNRKVSIAGSTASTGTVTEVDVVNISYANHNHVEQNYQVEYDYNDPTNGPTTIEANFVKMTFNLSSIPSKAGKIALFAHVNDPLALYTHTDFTYKYLAKDEITGAYSVSDTYSGFVLLQSFDCNFPVTKDNMSLELQYEVNFTANIEYLLSQTSVYDADTGEQLFVPIDLSRLSGFVAIPCDIEGEDKNDLALMSNYVAVSANTVDGFIYKPVASSLYKAIYLGDSLNVIPPSLFTNSEMQLYNKPTILVPDLLLTILRSNKFPYKVTWRLIDISAEDAPTEIADIENYALNNQEKIVYSNRINKLTSCKVCQEYTYGDTEHLSEEIPEAYPEVISIHIEKIIDNLYAETPTATKPAKFAVIVDYDKNNSTENPLDVTLKITDCKLNANLYSKLVGFDGVETVQHLYFGNLSWDVSGTPSFDPKFQPYV